LAPINSSYSLTAGDDYAIEVSFSSGTQEIGWAESNTKDPNELGSVETDPYGIMEITTSSVQEHISAAPDASSTALLLGGVLSVLALMKRKLS
jgi:hypothetical protein